MYFTPVFFVPNEILKNSLYQNISSSNFDSHSNNICPYSHVKNQNGKMWPDLNFQIT